MPFMMFEWLFNLWPILWKYLATFAVMGVGVLGFLYFPGTKLKALSLAVVIGGLISSLAYGWGVKDEHVRMVAEQNRSARIVKNESNGIIEGAKSYLDNRTPDRVRRDRAASPDNRAAGPKK